MCNFSLFVSWLTAEFPKPSDELRTRIVRPDRLPRVFEQDGVCLERKYHWLRVVCLGDAAHTVSPVLGQGLAAAVHDVSVLMRLFDDIGSLDRALMSFPAVLHRYSTFRVPECSDLFDMSESLSATFATSKLGTLLFILHTLLINKLHRLMPKMFSPAIQTAIQKTSRNPYRCVS